MLIGDISLCCYVFFVDAYFFTMSYTELSSTLPTSMQRVASLDQFFYDVVDKVLLTYAKTAEN